MNWLRSCWGSLWCRLGRHQWEGFQTSGGRGRECARCHKYELESISINGTFRNVLDVELDAIANRRKAAGLDDQRQQEERRERLRRIIDFDI